MSQVRSLAFLAGSMITRVFPMLVEDLQVRLPGQEGGDLLQGGVRLRHQAEVTLDRI